MRTSTSSLRTRLEVRALAARELAYRWPRRRSRRFPHLAFSHNVDALQDAPDMYDDAPVRWRRFILADPEGNEFCLR
jgi:hypothetical protein